MKFFAIFKGALAPAVIEVSGFAVGAEVTELLRGNPPERVGELKNSDIAGWWTE